MKRLAAIVCATLALLAPAHAGVATATLDQVRVDAPPDAALPLTLRFVDEQNTARTIADIIGQKPAVVVFADYTCDNLCGPIVAFAAAGLEQSGLTPGRDFRFVVIGLDPKDTRPQAQALKTSVLGADAPLVAASTFLTGAEADIRAATNALGYHYSYDAEHDQFAHPAAAFVVTAQGRVVRVLSGLGLSGADLRLALTDAGEGRVGSVLDQIRLRCFGFDPVKGIYTETISRWLTIVATTTIALLIAALAIMTWRPLRRVRP